MNTLPQISTFSFHDDHQVRVLFENGEPLFHANDLCVILEYSNPHDAVRRHVEKDDLVKREVIDKLGRKQNNNFVLEAGMWALMLGSETPKAKEVKKWVTSKVLPAIRKTGQYTVKPVANNRCSAAQWQELSWLIHRISHCFGHTDSAKQMIYNRLRVDFYLKSADDLPAEHFEAAKQMLEAMHNIADLYSTWRSKSDMEGIDMIIRDGRPWTPSVAGKLRTKLNLTINNHPDWVKLANMLK